MISFFCLAECQHHCFFLIFFLTFWHVYHDLFISKKVRVDILVLTNHLSFQIMIDIAPSYNKSRSMRIQLHNSLVCAIVNVRYFLLTSDLCSPSLSIDHSQSHKSTNYEIELRSDCVLEYFCQIAK